MSQGELRSDLEQKLAAAIDELFAILLDESFDGLSRYCHSAGIAGELVYLATVSISYASKADQLENPLAAHMLDNLKFVLEQIEEKQRPEMIEKMRSLLHVVENN